MNMYIHVPGALASYLAATRVAGRGASVPSLKMLKFLLVAGTYAMPGFPRAMPEDLPSLHVMSLEDTAVSISASKDLAKLFRGATTHMHEQGHCIPVRASDVDLYQSFIMQHTQGAAEAAAEDGEATEEQREELEAIQAIFMDDVLECSLGASRGTRVRIALSDTPASADVAIQFRLPPDYPATELPVFQMLGLPKDLTRHCEAAVREEAVASAGAAMLFQLVNAAREWLLSNNTGAGVACKSDALAFLSCTSAAVDYNGGSGGAGKAEELVCICISHTTAHSHTHTYTYTHAHTHTHAHTGRDEQSCRLA